MSLLTDFVSNEDKRIKRLFEYVDRFDSSEFDLFIIDFFQEIKKFGALGRVVLTGVKIKMSKWFPTLNLKDDSGFIESFKKLTESEKRCLIVTVCNNLCKASTVDEGSLFTFLENWLRKIPGTGESRGRVSG